MVGDMLLRIDGQSHIRETRLGPGFLLSPTAFFQTNPDAAAVMVDEVVARASEGRAAAEGLHVLDLYAGSGLFALPLARAGHTVTAVEENRQAVKDGIANAALNRIPQTRVLFVTARTEDYLRRLRATPDLAVLDPPRQGCAPSVIECVFRELRPRARHLPSRATRRRSRPNCRRCSTLATRWTACSPSTCFRTPSTWNWSRR